MTARIQGAPPRHRAPDDRPRPAPDDPAPDGDPQPRLHLVLPVPVRPAVRGAPVPLFAEYGGSGGLENYRGAIGDFKENLLWSVKITGLALAIDLAVSLPAAYALVRFPIPGRRIIFSVLQLSLYVPGAVIGLALLLTYTSPTTPCRCGASSSRWRSGRSR